MDKHIITEESDTTDRCHETHTDVKLSANAASKLGRKNSVKFSEIAARVYDEMWDKWYPTSMDLQSLITMEVFFALIPGIPVDATLNLADGGWLHLNCRYVDLPYTLDITFLNGEINVIVVGGKTEFTESVYSLKLFRSTVFMKKS